MVKDGPLTEELDAVIDKYGNTFEKMTIVPLATNKGLGLALAEGLTYCEYPLVARADTDDINVIKRFELQLQAFDANPELSIVGGYIDEFYIKMPKWCLLEVVKSLRERMKSESLANEEIHLII